MKEITRKFHLISALSIWLLLAISTATFAEEGADLVKHNAPQLWEATSEALTEPKARVFFQHWTIADIEYFNNGINHIYDETINKTGRVSHPEELYDKYGPDVVGILGEVHGCILSRSRIPADSSVVFMNENIYKALNTEGNIPDGITYSEAGGKLIIHQVFESKMGSGGYDRGQAKGYFKIWKRGGRTGGITVGTTGARRHYTADKILLQTSSGYEFLHTISIQQATFEQLERATMLVAPDEYQGNFRGLHQRFPLAKQPITDIMHRFMRILTRNRELEPFSVEGVNNPTKLTGDPLVDFRRTLNDVVLFYGRMPRSGDGGLRRLLAKRISQRKGQAEVFIHDLNNHSRLALVDHRNLPFRDNLYRKLLVISPFNADGNINQNVISALKAYVQVYEGEPHERVTTERVETLLELDPTVIQITTVERKPRPDESIVEVLMTRGAKWMEWREYFEEHNPQGLWKVTPSERGGCSAAYAAVAARHSQ